MTFGKHPPQRLWSANGDELNNAFKPTLAAEHFVPLCAEAPKDNYEQHTISDYGDLTDPKPFPIKTHRTKHLRQRRKTRPPSSTATPANGINDQQVNQVPSIGHNISKGSVEQATETEAIPKSSSSKSSSSTSLPSLTSADVSDNCLEVLTRHSEIVDEYDEVEDLGDAVILNARRVQLYTQKPQTFGKTTKLQASFLPS